MLVHVQKYEEEAEELLSNDPKRRRLVQAIEETQKIVRAKMDLFNRLQQFHDTLDAIRKENNQWTVITSQQAEGVHRRLEELLALIQGEYAPEANALSAQIEAIRASFFQLECDRIKEK
ncbi:unnamed protein product [Gongylonema pulchrum]|uniref:Tubulin-specific chaperone A n=1 Tax=Gongylonema pulchrum TaxID=637853 RepID=A0A183EL94_9BILA|nr:unnamed protein product [Gongylonema pulchrum]